MVTVQMHVSIVRIYHLARRTLDSDWSGNSFMRKFYSRSTIRIYVSRLRAALRFSRGVACYSGGSGITSQRMGSTRPYPVVNRNYFIWAGQAHHANKVGGPCSRLLSQLLLGATVVTTLILNAKAIGTVPMTHHGAECTVLPTLLTQ